MKLTVDVVILTLRRGPLEVLLVRRGIPPFKGHWAIPGGFVLARETLEEAAARELAEETGVGGVYLEQLYSFGDPGRDPRGRVVTVAYYALVPWDLAEPRAGTDAAEARWWRADAPPPLAFDHATILRTAVRRLRNKLDYTTVAFGLLPPKFTLSEVQRVYEAILGRPLDKRNFRRRLAQRALLRPLAEVRRGGRRPAHLYALARRRSG
jgi:8-oxo-dGTP diphosphatase